MKMTTEAKESCWICPSDKFVDDHHIDCFEGKLSPETVPLCRRCHRTYHDLGVDYFDDEYLDKAIELENRRREIQRASAHGNIFPSVPFRFTAQLQPMRREDIKRSDYFNKTHGVTETGETKGSRTPPFPFHLPHGEPLCGQQWVDEHLYDLMDWVPRIEIITPDLHLAVDINSKKKLRDVIKTMRGLNRRQVEDSLCVV